MRLADGSGGDDDPSLADPGHGKLETFSDFAEDVMVRDADAVEGDLGRPPGTHRLDGLAAPSHRPIDEERRDATLVALAFVGDGKGDREVRFETVRDEDLAAVEDPVGAVPNGRHLDVGRVRACVGLRQRKAAGSIAFDGGAEVPLFLLGVARVQDVVRVSAVGEGDQRFRRLHADQRGHQHAEVGAPVFFGRQQAPEPSRFCPLLQPADVIGSREGPAVEFGALRLRLQRQQLPGHELADRSQDHALFVGQPEVHIPLTISPPFHTGAGPRPPRLSTPGRGPYSLTIVRSTI